MSYDPKDLNVHELPRKSTHDTSALSDDLMNELSRLLLTGAGVAVHSHVLRTRDGKHLNVLQVIAINDLAFEIAELLVRLTGGKFKNKLLAKGNGDDRALKGGVS